MSSRSSPDPFLLIVSALLDSLATSDSGVTTADLLKLHALFGSMLNAALQLIDNREVVKVTLPGGRSVYQVSSSTGRSYTLYLSLPPLPSASPPPPETKVAPPTPIAPSTPQRGDDPDGESATEAEKEAERSTATRQSRRIHKLARQLERMYCPCAGFMFNSLAGDKNYLCKHLLAAVVGHQVRKVISTEVRFDGVVGLLGLQPVAQLS